MANYTRGNIALESILLDVENPRFASYFERMGRSSPTQDDVTNYLLTHESIGGLAKRIQAVGDLHPAEALVCCKYGDKYIVLEGNRRVCACKTLHKIFSENGKDWLPDDVMPEFPLLSQSVMEDSDLIRSTSGINAVIYNLRDEAQPYISDKHIDGVKKWESIEKSSYFYRMYQDIRATQPAMTSGNIIDEISKHTVSNKTEVKDCIVKYDFFMSVYKVLRERYQPEALTETNSYLPLVDRFMRTLMGGSDVGLNITLSADLKYSAHSGKEELFKKIIMLVGEAFLVRKAKNDCMDDGLPRINSEEIGSASQQKKLIKEDARIPGLYSLIVKYNNIAPTTGGAPSTPSSTTGSDTAGSSSRANASNNPTHNSPGNHGQETPTTYEPSISWRPNQPLDKRLTFTKEEGNTFQLSDDDRDSKIKFIIRELSKLSISGHPYACTLLYRTLLEAVTERAYQEKPLNENGVIVQYQSNNLASMIIKLVNNSGAITLTPSNRGAIKSNVTQHNLMHTLNDYIHNPKLVDINLIVSSWVTMKEYIKACLS
jgi:hypothetical protein